MSWSNIIIGNGNQSSSFVDVVKDFGVSEASSDNTAAFNTAFTQAGGNIILIPAGVYKTTGTISGGAITVLASPGAIIEHRPTNDTTDALVISGLDAGRTTIDGLTIRGMPTGQLYGRDLIRISKGDYITLRNVYLVNPKRDAFQVRPTASQQWVENLLMENVKIQFPVLKPLLTAAMTNVQTSLTVNNSTSYPDYLPFNVIIGTEVVTVGAIDKATHTLSGLTRGAEGTVAAAHSTNDEVQLRQGRDGFHFELSGAATSSFKPFINQVTMINCETRSVVRNTLNLTNTMTGAFASTAVKLSNFRIINNEFGAAKGADDIIRIQGGAGVAPIENISIEDSAIENTEAERTGAGILISGKMSGHFNVDNTIIFGSTEKVLGYDQFPHYFYRDVGSSAYVPVYSSHDALYKKERTISLASGGATADVHHLVAGEIIEGYVLDRYNASDNATWFNKFTTSGKSVPVQTSGNNIVMSVVNGRSLFISGNTLGNAMTTSGNLTITIDSTPFNVPLDATIHTTPDVIATAVSKFTFTGFRALRAGTQSVVFSRVDGALPVVSVNYGTTGITGNLSLDADNIKLLRVANTHINTPAILEVLMKRAVKEQSS